MGMLALIDADSLVFRTGHAAVTRSMSLTEAKKSLTERCDKVVSDLVALGAGDFDWYHTLHVKGAAKYRDRFHKVIPYKKTRRAKTAKPFYIKELYDFLPSIGTTFSIPSTKYEPDDAICIAASSMTESSYIVAHVDKDLKQIPGQHYNLFTGETYYIEEPDALLFKYTQALTGDAADDIPGCPGIGPARAKRILTECKGYTEEDWYLAVVETYKTQLKDRDEDYITDYLYETMNLVHLLTDEPPRGMWQPPVIF